MMDVAHLCTVNLKTLITINQKKWKTKEPYGLWTLPTVNFYSK